VGPRINSLLRDLQRIRSTASQLLAQFFEYLFLRGLRLRLEFKPTLASHTKFQVSRRMLSRLYRQDFVWQNFV